MKNKYFIKWWLMVCLILVGIGFMYKYEMFTRINDGDVTKISFGIFALFAFFTVKLGVLTYCVREIDRCAVKTTEWFAEKFLALGMIGTVIGFLYTLAICFENIDVQNVALMQKTIANMAIGMSTALYTTAAGLVCSFLLKLQIYNIDMGLSCEIQDS